MLLQEMVLRNIRSYENQTIVFPTGTTLLCGDIGSGKSSILLAVEFALFGASRTELPANLLLRKGANTGSVELRLTVEGEEVIIKRSLRKEKDTIKQLPGHIIRAGVKRDLMPIELKSEMMTLFGYPPDLISKSKNHLFRYTVYTPQEEMKRILLESEQERLNVLRKIFNVDKYKVVRENVDLFLKKMRVEITVLKTRIEPLDGLREQVKELVEMKMREQKLFDNSRAELGQVVERRAGLSSEVRELEEKQKEMQLLQEEYKSVQVRLEEKNKQHEELIRRKEELEKEKVQMASVSGSVERCQREIISLQKERETILVERRTREGKIEQLRQIIEEKRAEIGEISEDIALLEEKEKLKVGIVEELIEKEVIEMKLLQIDELYEKTVVLVSRNKAVLEENEHDHGLQDISMCPTCFQEVSNEHKEKIVLEKEERVAKARRLLSDLKQKERELIGQREQGRQSLRLLSEKESALARLEVQIEHLKLQKKNVQERKKNLLELVQENNKLMEEGKKLDNVGVEKITKRIEQQQELLEMLQKRERVIKEIELCVLRVKVLDQEIDDLHTRSNQIRQTLEEQEDHSELISYKREKLMKVLEEEKVISVNVAEREVQLSNVKEKEEEVRGIVRGLEAGKEELVMVQEQYHWLEEHFIGLTFTIEKQVMVSIHRLFNELFQEWFSLLVDDDELYGRVDEGFSPVIEQNGYEVTFGTLSGGEKTCAALAYRLALNRVINDVIHQIKTKDLLVLDEPTDGFSLEQLDKVRDVLDVLGLGQIIIVSHESKIESFAHHVIQVRKSGHVSEII